MTRSTMCYLHRMPKYLAFIATAVLVGTALPRFAVAADLPVLAIRPAETAAAAQTSPVLAVAKAGDRIVSVGEHGVVLLSDDGGKTFQQADTVPVSSTLTSVAFVNAKTGWAVGHWGVILRTDDAGRTWHLQRSDLKNDQPLFSVYFKDEREGWAVGLWSLMLHTTDGGKTWQPLSLPPAAGEKKSDRNLYSIFANSKGSIVVVGERGTVLVSKDTGRTWEYKETGYQGSFWCGALLKDGTLMIGGLRGSLYRSTDEGETWSRVESDFKSSITAIVPHADNSVSAVALDGVVLNGQGDQGRLTGQQRADRLAFTAGVDAPNGKLLLFSTSGPVKN